MPRHLKPRVLGDIKPRHNSPWRDSFVSLPRRLNLSYKEIGRLPLKKFLEFFICISAAAFFVLGSAIAPTMFSRASNSQEDGERAALEAQLKELESQINQYEGQIVSYQKQGKTMKSEITRLNDKIAKLNLQIQAVNLTLRELDKKISETHTQILTTEISLADHKETLAQLIRSLYNNEKVSLIEVFLKNPQLSDFFNDLRNITLLQDNLRVTVEQVSDLRDQLKDRQEQFFLAKADVESVRVYQTAQKNEIDNIKAEKNNLLAITKGQESKYQALLKQTKENAAKIRSRIFQLLGGGELSFEDAYKYAKIASGATGIRPALILAVLDRESALGQNVGRCSYKTAMSPQNQALFLEITKELNINPDVVTVSCPNKDGVYGGAMGPAQFTPSTWNIYKDEVSKITGRQPASPWNNGDAFVATALYLKNAMAGCSSAYSSEVSQERCAASKYYAGSRWRSYLWTYGEAVVSRARSFQEDIETITS